MNKHLIAVTLSVCACSALATVFKITPAVSLRDVNQMPLQPGDSVLFQRGGIWRGQLIPKSGTMGKPITYASYGEGEKPILEASYAKNRPEDWKNLRDSLWVTEIPTDKDIGNIILNHGKKGCATKRFSLSDLKNNLEFFSDRENKRLYLFSKENPAKIFSSLELAEKIMGVLQGGAHDVVYDGLHVRYTAAHGFGGSGTKRLTIRNCDLSWIGGGFHYRSPRGKFVRFGNGVEFWGNAKDHLIESNRFWQIYDAAMTNQSGERDSLQSNIVWRANEIRDSEYSFEYWQQGQNAKTYDIFVENNRCYNAGGGWGHKARWNPNAAHLMLYDNTALTRNFIVRGNHFSRSANCGIRLFNDWKGCLTYQNNVWKLDGETPLCRYHDRPTNGLKYLYPDRLDRIGKDDPVEIEEQSERPDIFGPSAEEHERFQEMLISYKRCPTCAKSRRWPYALNVVPFDKLDISRMSNARVNLSVDRHPLSVGGVHYAKGIGTHAPSRWEVALGGKALSISVTVGVDDEMGKNGSIEFLIIADGQIAARSGVMRGGMPGKVLYADLTDVDLIELIVTDANDGINCDHADWVAGSIRFMPGAKPVDLSVFSTPLGILTPPLAATPRINGPKVYGVRPGHPILWRVPVTGEKPLNLQLAQFKDGKKSGLSKGLVFNPDTRILSGSIARRGEYPILITAKNAKGEAERIFTIKVGDKLALTPPMGWNSWNWVYDRITDKLVRSAADAMIDRGLADHGYQYVNIDDFWQRTTLEKWKNRAELQGPERSPEGKILPNAKFPDMKGLADYIHSKGLKAGLYSSPGPYTCGGVAGSWEHEEIDARTWAEWGFDYVKYDWCSYGKVVKKHDLQEGMKPYQLMGNILARQNRDIVFSLCQYGMYDVSKWGASVGGNCWRTTGDVWDNWGSITRAIDLQKKIWNDAHPGGWNDPDMLVMESKVSQSHLTTNEQYTHISLWSLCAAPLLIGCDLAGLDDFTFSLLTNDEVIEIDQDELGVAAKPIWKYGPVEVWIRPLADGAYAVGLYNTNAKDQKITCDFADLELVGPFHVRDVWRQKDLGRFTDTFRSFIPGHATMLYRIKK